MLKELSNIEEINAFFEELLQKPSGQINRARIYGMAYDQQQQLAKEQEIEKQVESKYRRIVKTTIISDDMAIVEAVSRLNNKEETNFYPVIRGKYHAECCMSFDEALVMALSYKYHQERCAPQMIYNMLRMDIKWDEAKEKSACK